MATQKTNIIGPDGNPREGEDVRITESLERNSEVTLEDGTILYIKAAPISATKVSGLWDPNNNPVYMLNSNTVVGVKFCPDHLKKGSKS